MFPNWLCRLVNPRSRKPRRKYRRMVSRPDLTRPLAIEGLSERILPCSVPSVWFSVPQIVHEGLPSEEKDVTFFRFCADARYGPLFVPFSVTGTAVYGRDYTGVFSKLGNQVGVSFPDGVQSVRGAAIFGHPDGDIGKLGDSNGDTLVVTLPPGPFYDNGGLGRSVSQTITIAEQPAPVISITATSTAVEPNPQLGIPGNPGNFQVTVICYGGFGPCGAPPRFVHFTLGGSAAYGRQYTIAGYDPSTQQGTIDLSQGSTINLTVTPIDDGRPDDTSTITVTLSPSALPMGNSSATISLLDSDSPHSAPVVDRNWLNQVYLDVLHRPVDASGVQTWWTALYQGATRNQVVQAILNSPEYRENQINSWYEMYLGRQVDPSGLNLYLGSYGVGATDEQIQAALLGSPEFFTDEGSTNAGFLNALYTILLKRSIDPSGSQTYSSQLASGASRTYVAQEILSSNEYRTDLVTGYYTTYLRRGPDPSGLNVFVTQLSNGARDEDVIAQILGSDEYYLNEVTH